MDQKPTIAIRKLVATDLPAVTAMLSAIDPWRRLGIDLTDDPLALAAPPVGLYGHSEAGGLPVSVVRFDPRGMMSSQPYISILAVAPAWQGRGIGEELLLFAEARLFECGQNVFLCVSSFNEGAQRFYERHGYEKVGEFPDYFVRGASEWLMRKTKGPLRG